MDKITLKGIPTFHIQDYYRAKEFYAGFLGFMIDWEHRFGHDEPVYMQISHHGLTLHLTENQRFQSGVIIFVETHNIDGFRNEIKRRAKGIVPEIIITNWNTKQMEIQDPFGNLLRFNENNLG